MKRVYHSHGPTDECESVCPQAIFVELQRQVPNMPSLDFEEMTLVPTPTLTDGATRVRVDGQTAWVP